MARIITFGNEKGGSGKSTTSMHVFAALAHSGYSVGVIDLDLRQRSFFRYLENRQRTIEATGIALPMPKRITLSAAENDSVTKNKAQEENDFTLAVEILEPDVDVIIIDCPGAYTNYANMAHSIADVLITPINDSFVDFDLLATIDPVTGKIEKPSVYAEMVWDARRLRQKAGLPAIDWVVVRNRISNVEARNRRKVSSKLSEFSKRIGFRVVTGFSERVVFRELFTRGVTLLDLPMLGERGKSLSNVAARQEMRDLMKAIDLKGFDIQI